MARRPDLGKHEEIWTSEDLKEIMHNLSLLSEHGVREFYQRAYRECAIINSQNFPPHVPCRSSSKPGNNSENGVSLEELRYERVERNLILIVRSNCEC